MSQRYDNEVQGPTVSWGNKGEFFKIDFASSGVKAFLTSPVRITPAGTLGDKNRAYLHERLDDCIALYLSTK